MGYHKENIWVVVKTYPNLSSKYDETVCVGGVNDQGEWRRLYPIRFRDLPYDKQFKKFQWITLDIKNYTKNEKCMRRESHKVKDETIVLGRVLDTKDGWKKRNKLLFDEFELLNKSVEELRELRDSTKGDCISMGFIKPIIEDFKRTPKADCREWERALIEGSQSTLSEFFTGEKYQSPLDHIPYKFSYVFKCNDDSCTGHDIMCEDWELYQLYRAMKEKYDEEVGWEKTKQKYYDFMIERNVHFIMGTESKYNKFLIIGVYYPPLPKT